MSSTLPRALAHGAVFGLALLAGWVARQQRDVDWSVFGTIACAIGVVLVLLVGLPAAVRGLPTRKVLLTGVLVAWCGCSLGWTVVHSLARLPSTQGAQIWSVFHYYMGAKYFSELGYTGLYEQALAADAEGEHLWWDVHQLRNLQTYEVEPLDRQRLERFTLWSDARWAEFKHDVEFLAPRLSQRSWRNIFRDRGYNSPPSSTAWRRLLTGLELRPRTLVLLGSLDVIALLAAFVMVGRVFGPLRAMVCATWVALYFGNGGDRFVGAPFLYDYLAAMLLAACALRRERPVLAGVLLGYAAMMRVYPGILLVGLVWWVVAQGGRGRMTRRPALRLAAGFASACLLLFLVGLGSGRGVGGWREFASNLTLHTEQHVVGNKRIGLAHLFTVDWSNPPPADQDRSERFETWRSQEKAWLVTAVAVGLLWLWAMSGRRQDLFDTTFSAILLVFCGVVLSRYYWSAACLLMLTGRPVRGVPLGGLGPVSIAAALFAWCAAVHAYSIFDDGSIHQYLVANALGLVLILTSLALMIVLNRRSSVGVEREAGP